MSPRTPVVALMFLVFALPALAAGNAPARPAPSAPSAPAPAGMPAMPPHSPMGNHPIPETVAPEASGKFTSVTLHVFNRIFPDFHDKVEALPRKPFRVGDTEYTGRVIEYVPDFSLNLKTHQVVSRGKEPKNPAFRIAVTKGSVASDTSWAFFNMPPHFGARNVLAFVATRITFPDRPPLESNDSLAIKIRQREGAAH